jgi:hypothetical protein
VAAVGAVEYQEGTHMSQRSQWFSRTVAGSAIALAGCGGGGEPGSASAPPARAGQVWEVQSSEDRAYLPGSIVAFVNGVHVMVVDGDRVYAGMTPLAATSGTNGARTITFSSGLTAEMVPSAQGAEMRFSSGERVPLRTRQGE